MQTPGKSCRGNADSHPLRCLTFEYTPRGQNGRPRLLRDFLCLTMALPAPKSDTPSPNL
jgi:hypothetical protein